MDGREEEAPWLAGEGEEEEEDEREHENENNEKGESENGHQSIIDQSK